MPFALDNLPTLSEVSEAVNYLLANFGNGSTVDPVTGQIIAPGGTLVGYLYQYLAIKYADSADGSVNFSNTPTNRQYFGIRNSSSATESTNPADYIWSQASGGFGTTKFLWYVTTGGRQIQFEVSTSAPDSGWVVDSGASIDLDIVLSNTAPVIAEAFVTFFAPPTLQVPRSGNPLSPSFTGIIPRLYATDQGAIVPFVDAQTDSAVNFVNGTWRIGNSSTTGNGDISYTNLTVGSPTDGGDFAEWPAPTAMSSSPAYITVPIRYKNSSGIVSQASVATCQLIFGDPGPVGEPGPSIDISGYVSFVQNPAGAFTPPNTALSALTQNIDSPTYSWSITGATPTSSTSSTVVITPTSSSTGVTVTLTVNGTNLLSPQTKTISLPVVYDGAAGAAGANGVMSAFPSIYIWTGSSSVPTRPSTTSTYNWSTGAYTAPAGWSTTPPSNTTPGNYLWEITVPLNVSATTTTSTLDWTNTSYPIRAIAYNGANGAAGTAGTNGASTFVITRSANDSSAPTNAEVNALLGRSPVAGDICTVSYNSGNNAVVYRYTTAWSLFQTYITGSLIVNETITSDKMVTNLLSADNVLTRGLTVRDTSGNIILSSGQNLDYSYINPSTGWLNNNISINSDGTLSGAGSGQVTLGGLGAGALAYQNSVDWNTEIINIPAFGGFAFISTITSANISTYIASAAIGTAYIANAAITNALIADAAITTAKIGDAQISSAKIIDASITTAKIGTAQVDTLQIAGNAVTVPSSAYTSGSISFGTSYTTVQTLSVSTPNAPVLITAGFSLLSSGTVLSIAIYRDSTLIYEITNVYLTGFGSPYVNPPISVAVKDDPGNGTFSYTLQLKCGSSQSAINRSLVALVVKR